jgi:hypothetical protein
MLFSPESIAQMQTLTDDALPGVAEFVIQQGAPTNESGDVYDPITDTWSSGVPASGVDTISHKLDAAQVNGDPDRFAAAGLTMLSSIVLKVQPDPESDFEPKAGMKCIWSEKNYAVKWVDPVAPDGKPVLWYVYAAG